MGFKREWSASCPRVWNKWKTDGVTWVVQDLPPEDDKLAIQLMLEEFLPDETLCSSLGIDKNAKCIMKMSEFWQSAVSQRMSLACYRVVENEKTLAALNICVVKCIDDEDPKYQMEEDGYFELLQTLKYLDSKCNVFEELGVDKYLYGLGLLVTRPHRGWKLGAKLLAAREPMCSEFGLAATSTLFTGPASQRLAARCGFRDTLEVSLHEMAVSGLNYAKHDERTVKIMSKKYS